MKRASSAPVLTTHNNGNGGEQASAYHFSHCPSLVVTISVDWFHFSRCQTHQEDGHSSRIQELEGE